MSNYKIRIVEFKEWGYFIQYKKNQWFRPRMNNKNYYGETVVYDTIEKAERELERAIEYFKSKETFKKKTVKEVLIDIKTNE